MIALVILCTGLAHAHHGTATARVDGSAMQPMLGPGDDDALRLDIGVGLASRSFGRTLSGGAKVRTAPLGTVVVQQLVTSVQLSLPTGTRVTASIPLAYLDARPTVGPSRTRAGFGDVSLRAAQEVFVQRGGADRQRATLRWQVSAGGTAPTGQYDTDAAMSLTEVSSASDGELQIVTYDTRATLGSGAWSVSVGTTLDWMPSDKFGVQLGLGGATPVARTSDDVRWGDDLEASLLSRSTFLDQRLEIGAGVGARHHSRDTVPAIDEVTGASERSRVGGRDQIAALLRVTGRLSRTATCGAQVGVPVWQRAGGIQLMETWSAGATCSVGWRETR